MLLGAVETSPAVEEALNEHACLGGTEDEGRESKKTTALDSQALELANAGQGGFDRPVLAAVLFEGLHQIVCLEREIVRRAGIFIDGREAIETLRRIWAAEQAR